MADEGKCWKLTADLLYPDSNVPKVRYHFYGATRDEAESQLEEAAEHDAALKALVLDLEEDWQGMVLRIAYKKCSLESIRKPELGYT